MNKYLRLLIQLLPTGLAWNKSKDSNLRKLLDKMSQEFLRIEERIKTFIEEMDPRTTFELLTDWESMLGLPDKCSGNVDDLTLSQRRGQIVQKLNDRGSLSESYLEQIAADLGYDVDVDVYAAQKFQVGKSRIGDPLTNSPWAWVIVVRIPADSITKFRTGQSTIGEPLRFVDNDILRCTLLKRKPAHGDIFFIFE